MAQADHATALGERDLTGLQPRRQWAPVVPWHSVTQAEPQATLGPRRALGKGLLLLGPLTLFQEDPLLVTASAKDRIQEDGLIT